MTNEAVYQGEFYFPLDVFSICLDLLKNIHLNKTVVICFHFSIFVLLETAESAKITNIQRVRQYIRIFKSHVSKQKIPFFLRDFLFKTIPTADLELLLP